MNDRFNGSATGRCCGLVFLAAALLLLGLFLLLPAPHHLALAQGPTHGVLLLQTPTPTCRSYNDQAVAFTFCDAAHDDVADEYASPLKNVRTDGLIPPVILKAIGWYESSDSPRGGWTQCVNGVPYTSTDGCAWGLMQIRSGMNCDAPANQFNAETQQRVKYDYRYNIAMGAFMLKRWKWDEHQTAGHIIGDGDPRIAEHWYYAVWAYNEWSFKNSPNNTARNPCSNWPISPVGCAYQDTVWWWAAHPPTRGGRTLWAPVNLTCPDKSLFPRYSWQWDSWNWRIADPLPVHQDWCRNCLPLVLKNYPPCARPIQNGNFEARSAYWTLGGLTIISLNRPHGGSYSAWLGGYDNANDTLYQTITIPSTGPTGRPVVSARLTYYWYMTTEETSPSTDFDYLYVQIRGSPIRTVETLTNRSVKDTWAFSSFDVSEFIGQTVQVYFRATTEATLPTSFFVDDVGLYACEGG